MSTLLTIAGSDPSGGAGIEADLSVFAQLGVRGRTAITALTIQSYLPLVGGGQIRKADLGGVEECSVHPTSPAILRQLLRVQTEDPPGAIKIGMLATREIVWAVVECLRRFPKTPVVLDTVFSASSGLALLEPSAIPIFKSELMPLATIVTPNLSEAALLTGEPVSSLADMERAAHQIAKLSPNATVVIKGGHLAGAPVDVVLHHGEICRLAGERIPGQFRGTGCRLASAIAVGLAKGKTPIDAIRDAKAFLQHLLQ